MMNIDLSNKVILVSGASSGIGAEIASQLAAAGAIVALHGHCHKEEAHLLAEKLGNGSLAFQADLADEEQCRKLFHDVKKAFGKIDGLVNNAGIALRSPVDHDDQSWMMEWRRTQAVNLNAAALLSKMAINHFQERSGGKIIFIASRAAFRGETEDFLAYAAAKGGMVSLSRSIARSFGKFNITSFVIAPGWVRTPMIEDVMSRVGEEAILGEISLNRLTLPSDVAPLVVFISSGLLDHCTGATFDVNAGSYMH